MSHRKRHFFRSGPPHFSLIHHFWRRQRSETETIQQSNPSSCRTNSHRLVWPEDFTAPHSAWLVFYLWPCDRALDLLSWRLRPANAANLGGLKPWREFIYCWYDAVSELLAEMFEACEQGYNQPHPLIMFLRLTKHFFVCFNFKFMFHFAYFCNQLAGSAAPRRIIVKITTSK